MIWRIFFFETLSSLIGGGGKKRDKNEANWNFWRKNSNIFCLKYVEVMYVCDKNWFNFFFFSLWSEVNLWGGLHKNV